MRTVTTIFLRGVFFLLLSVFTIHPYRSPHAHNHIEPEAFAIAPCIRTYIMKSTDLRRVVVMLEHAAFSKLMNENCSIVCENYYQLAITSTRLPILYLTHRTYNVILVQCAIGFFRVSFSPYSIHLTQYSVRQKKYISPHQIEKINITHTRRNNSTITIMHAQKCLQFFLYNCNAHGILASNHHILIRFDHYVVIQLKSFIFIPFFLWATMLVRTFIAHFQWHSLLILFYFLFIDWFFFVFRGKVFWMTLFMRFNHIEKYKRNFFSRKSHLLLTTSISWFWNTYIWIDGWQKHSM